MDRGHTVSIDASQVYTPKQALETSSAVKLRGITPSPEFSGGLFD